jgi:hypothetical protein
MESLEMRRLRHDLVIAYTIRVGLVSNACEDLFIMSISIIPTRGHSFKMYQRYAYCRVGSQKYFFAECVIQPWNSLPAKNEHFKSPATFKSFINKVNLTSFSSYGFQF